MLNVLSMSNYDTSSVAESVLGRRMRGSGQSKELGVEEEKRELGLRLAPICEST